MRPPVASAAPAAPADASVLPVAAAACVAESPVSVAAVLLVGFAWMRARLGYTTDVDRAVSRTWIAAHPNADACDDGCGWNPGRVACRDRECVTLTPDGDIDASCTKRPSPGRR